jgi:hypothetical protein
MTSEVEGISAPARRIDWESVACVTSIVLLVAVAAGPLYRDVLPWTVQDWHWAAAFGIACAPALITSWVVSILAGRLPRRPGATPKLNHISGWTFLLLAVPISLVVALALWAAASPSGGRAINAAWGIGVTAGLAVLFIFAAWAPSWNLGQRASWALAILRPLVLPFGLLMSIIDSLLVFVVATAAGASRHSWQMRYFILAGFLLPCAFMGYWLAAPWGLIPLAAGFAVAISMSRRWAWVEDDRELAMLNGRFVGPHLRIGFEQDLRDEAMLSFMSMFFLVPLALRQVEGWQTIFNMANGNVNDMLDWIAFFGAELAKAVPFVDWAEIYNVHGSAGIEIGNDPMARHVMFSTRVLVDLVFLAALLQALGISARNAKQRELFNGGSLNRLDPFIEKTEFRKLVRRGDDGAWQADEAAVLAFPEYDVIRLGELSDPSQPKAIQVAAKALRMKQGGSTSAEFHDELLRRAMTPRRDREAVMEVVQAIRGAGPERQVYELDQARRALNGAVRMVEARTSVMRLLIDAPQSPERTIALLEAVQAGPQRDSLGPVRAVAIAGLAVPAANDEPSVRALIRQAAKQGDTDAERKAAKAIMDQIGES